MTYALSSTKHAELLYFIIIRSVAHATSRLTFRRRRRSSHARHIAADFRKFVDI